MVNQIGPNFQPRYSKKGKKIRIFHRLDMGGFEWNEKVDMSLWDKAPHREGGADFLSSKENKSA